MKAKSLIMIAGVAAFVAQTSGCYKTGVQASMDQIVRTTTADTSTKVVADYQPWFGDPQHINVGYSTQNPDVLRKQIEAAKNMGIYAFAVDWYGQRRPFLDRSYAILQPIAAQNDFKVSLMYDETEQDNGRATEDALSAMQHAYQSYIRPGAPGREAYLEYQGRPVIFIFPKRGNTDWDRVREYVNGWESPPLLIYKYKPPERYEADFDGYYAWVHPGPRGWQANGSEWGQDYLRTFYRAMQNKYSDKITVGGVWPGFNDTKASWSLNRHMDRRCGKTFQDTLQLFRENDSEEHPIPFIMIATWNDYEEGTQIENGIAHCSPKQAAQSPSGEQ
jgi:hypothetical protein